MTVERPDSASLPGGVTERDGLPETIGADDLKIINEVLAALFVELRLASALYQGEEFPDRAATLIALSAVWRFLMRFRPALDERLHVPLMNLSNALLGLNNNNVQPILQRSAPRRGGRAQDSPDRQALIGIAVGAVERLLWTGMDHGEADKAVAAELAKLGVKPNRGGNPITARTVREWRNRVGTDLPLFRPLLAGGPEATAEWCKRSDPVVAARVGAVLNAVEMLTDKWHSRIQGLPQAAARKFVLASLTTSIAKLKLSSG
jgi:hypothetical protein